MGSVTRGPPRDTVSSEQFKKRQWCEKCWKAEDYKRAKERREKKRGKQWELKLIEPGPPPRAVVPAGTTSLVSYGSSYDVNPGYGTNQGYGSAQGYVNPGGSREPSFSEASVTSSASYDNIGAPISTVLDLTDEEARRIESPRYLRIGALLNDDIGDDSAQQAARRESARRLRIGSLLNDDTEQNRAQQAAAEHDDYGSKPMDLEKSDKDQGPFYDERGRRIYDPPAKSRRPGRQ